MPESIVIDAKSYPLAAWEKVESGRTLSREYTIGAPRGVGPYISREEGRIHWCSNIDITAAPYFRLHPEIEFDLTASNGIDGSVPFFSFLAEDSGGTDYGYILNGRYGYKVDITAGAIDEAIDFGANSVCGRRALFESTWYIPLGGTNEAKKLTTVAVPPATDTFTDIPGVKARHFAVVQDEDVAKLARATDNFVSLSADGSSFGDQFEVGDSSTDITDLIVVAGELYVVKPEGIFRFDPAGNSLLFIGTPDKSLLQATHEGSNSYAYGPYGYWPTAQLWRLFGEQATPIGPEAEPGWSISTTGNGPPVVGHSQHRYICVTGWGRWLYATEAIPTLSTVGDLMFGFIEDDGSVRWHGTLYRPDTAGNRMRVDITGEAGGKTGPILWIGDDFTNKIAAMVLALDGSPRRTGGNSAAGRASLTGYIFFQEDDADSPSRLKQLRRMWVFTENFPTNGTATLALEMYPDGGSVVTVATLTGSDFNGFISRSLTPGSSDTLYRGIPALKLATTATYAPGDPRIRLFGYEFRTASLYHARIPLRADTIKGYAYGIAGSLRELRRLQNAGPITVKVKEPRQTSYTMHVAEVRETEVGGKGQEFDVDVYLESFVTD